MRYTKATRSILAFIEEHGFITCNIASRIQYKGQKQAYINAARKLRTMEQNKLLVHYIYPQTKEYIYQIKAKQISEHKKILIDFYSRLNELVDEIIYFNSKEISWPIAKRRNDGHIIYKFNNNIYGILIEVDFSHYTSQEKLMDIYNSKEVHMWYKENYGTDNYFPSILIISLLGNTKYSKVPFSYNTLDFEFSNIKDVLGV